MIDGVPEPPPGFHRNGKFIFFERPAAFVAAVTPPADASDSGVRARLVALEGALRGAEAARRGTGGGGGGAAASASSSSTAAASSSDSGPAGEGDVVDLDAERARLLADLANIVASAPEEPHGLESRLAEELFCRVRQLWRAYTPSQPPPPAKRRRR